MSRILIESLVHEKTCFVTLTYDPSFYDGDSLVPSHCTKWLKRLRHAYPDQKIRYFLVGEYGDRRGRPHYHLALFGIGQESEDIIRSTWRCPDKGISMGHVQVGDLSPQSARYIAGYVTKKLTSPDDPRLAGRFPEFARMSQGLGKTAIRDIARSIAPYVHLTSDVPTFLRFGGRTYPLGRYLRSQLRKALDIYSVDPLTGEVKYGQTHAAAAQNKKDMQTLFDDWFNSPSLQTKSFKDYLTGMDDGKVNLLADKLSNSNIKRTL